MKDNPLPMELRLSHENDGPDGTAEGKKLTPSITQEHNLKYRTIPGTELCGKCQNVIQKVQQSYQDYGQIDLECYPSSYIHHHHTYTKLKTSAENGCSMCAMICRQPNIRTFANQWSYDSTAEYRGTKSKFQLCVPFTNGDPKKGVSGLDYCSATIHGFLTTTRGKIFTLRRHTFTPHEITYLLDWIGINYDASTPNTRDALPMCKIWFEKCRASHTKCSVPHTPHTKYVAASLAKSRFLAVSHGKLRLCLGEEVELNSPYATLSHCWGSLEIPTLKQSNLNSFREYIPYHTLPKTFRDAINICRYLEISYLWIDSLCIVQDSEEDWTIQSALMAQIYGGCELNIAATSASDARIGCFFDRPNQWLVQVSSTGADNKDWIYDILPSPLITPADNVLITRGWVVQERFLSKRKLHFTNTQVFWECETESACETCPDGYPETISVWSPYRDFDLERGYTNRLGWNKLVERYTRAKLTKPTDRLVAMEGSARAIQAASNENYVAGMWIEWIGQQLPWATRGFVPDRSIINVPSWSWASGTGSIIYFIRPRDMSAPGKYQPNMNITLYDWKVDYESENHFRGVKNALLRLSCTQLCLASFNSHSTGPKMRAVNFGNHEDYIIWLEVFPDSVDMIQEGKIVFMYFLVVTNRCGLLLEPTAQSDGQFRRIGAYICSAGSMEKVQPTNLVGKGKSNVFSGVEVNEKGDEIYIIDLV